MDIGVNAEVIGDPVIAFCDDETAPKEKVMPESVGFNIGHSFGKVWGDEETIKQEYIRLAKSAKKAGWKVRWFIVWPQDREITLQTARASGTEDEVYEIYREPELYLRLVRTLSVFVGMKLHSVVLSTCAYVPSVMLEYRPKCRDYMMSIGHKDHVIRTDEFRGEAVWDFVKYLNSRRAVSSEVLYKSIKPLRDRQFKKAEDIMAGMLK
jgi:polysaccharide pyruvyl transferase WcaK-like protein